MNVTKKSLGLRLLNLSSLTIFSGLLIWSLTGRKTMLLLFSNVSYYLILLLAVLWTVTLVIFLKEKSFSLNRLLHNHWSGFALAFVLTALVFVSVKVGFKTLSDETNLVSVSQSMAVKKSALNCTMAKFYYGNLNPINEEIDKRPLVFPFLVSVLHTLSGVRYQNAFLLNFLATFLFLAGIYIVSRKLLDPPSAAAAVLLVLSYPVFTTFATSAGFDILNSAFFILVLAIVYCFIKSPSSCCFAFLFVSLLVFANIRYESVLFLPLILLLLLPKIKWRYVKDSSFLIFVAPLVNLPYLWNRILKPRGHFESVKDVQLFSFSALAKNISSFLGNLFDFSYTLPYAGVITLGAFLIFTYLIVQTARKKIFVENHQRHFMLVVLVSVAVSTLMYFAHFFGRYTHPSSARFFITFSICLALAPVALRVANPRLISGRVLLLLAAVAFAYYHPIAVEGRFINTLTLNRQTGACIDFLKKLDDKNILIISSRPGQHVALGYGAVDFTYANKNAGSILNEARRHLYSRIIVFQEIMYDTSRPGDDTTLDVAYRLKPLYEIQITATAFLRISEVVIDDKQH